MSSEKMEVFATDPQIKFMKSRATEKTFLGGRGCGKTNTLGYCVGSAYREMPRAKFALLGLTYVQLDTVVLPVIREALEMMGIFEKTKGNPFGHYVVGVIPPADWQSPHKKPGKLAYKYCMTFINGFTLQFVSQDNKDSQRGFNFDGMFVDESATVSEDFIYKIIKKAVRGNTNRRFSKSKFFHCHYEFTSAAWLKEGQHIYKREIAWKEQNEERSQWENKQKKAVPPKFLYVESTCLDNPVTGQKYWDDQKAVDDPLIFDVEVANMRLSSMPDGFYHSFKSSVHLYSYAMRYEFDDETGLHLSLPNDYRIDKELDLTMDFNRLIHWLVVIQEVKNESRIINSNFVKPHPGNLSTDIVIQNAEWFCERYKDHQNKVVNIYGDPNGDSRNVQDTDDHETPFESFATYLEKKGWTVIKKWRRRYPKYKRRFFLMNAILSEVHPNLPRIRANQHNNKVLVLTLQTTGMGEDFKKTKKTEKLQPLHKREYAPDGTDALDYYYYEKYDDRMPDAEVNNHHVYVYRG